MVEVVYLLGTCFGDMNLRSIQRCVALRCLAVRVGVGIGVNLHSTIGLMTAVV